MTDTKKIHGQATEAKIESWKKEHGDIFQVSVDDHVAYFKKPGRKILAAASRALQESSIQYVEDLLENTYLGGSREVIDNDDYFLAAVQVVDQMMQLKTAELVKL